MRGLRFQPLGIVFLNFMFCQEIIVETRVLFLKANHNEILEKQVITKMTSNPPKLIMATVLAGGITI